MFKTCIFKQQQDPLQRLCRYSIFKPTQIRVAFAVEGDGSVVDESFVIDALIVCGAWCSVLVFL